MMSSGKNNLKSQAFSQPSNKPSTAQGPISHIDEKQDFIEIDEDYSDGDISDPHQSDKKAIERLIHSSEKKEGDKDFSTSGLPKIPNYQIPLDEESFGKVKLPIPQIASRPEPQIDEVDQRQEQSMDQPIEPPTPEQMKQRESSSEEEQESIDEDAYDEDEFEDPLDQPSSEVPIKPMDDET